jgi:hypothetical protein
MLQTSLRLPAIGNQSEGIRKNDEGSYDMDPARKRASEASGAAVWLALATAPGRSRPKQRAKVSLSVGTEHKITLQTL